MKLPKMPEQPADVLDMDDIQKLLKALARATALRTAVIPLSSVFCLIPACVGRRGRGLPFSRVSPAPRMTKEWTKHRSS